MKKFIKNIVLLSFILFCVFFLLDKAITLGLRQSNMLRYDNFTKLFNGKINADLIVNGSSTAYMQISPKILDSILNLNSYNLGLDGIDFVPQKLQYDLYEQNNTFPKIVVQIVDHGSMVKAEGDLFQYMRFAPYLDIDLVRNTTKLYNGFESIDYYLPLFKYSGKPMEAIIGMLSLIDITVSPSYLYKGYLERDIPWDGSFERFKESQAIDKTDLTSINGLDKSTCELFEEYIISCKRNNIKLFIVYPPVYYEFTPYDVNREMRLEYYNNISQKYNIPFLDFSNDELSFQKRYFYNSVHLNKNGSEIFTKKLSLKIKSQMQSNNLEN